MVVENLFDYDPVIKAQCNKVGFGGPRIINMSQISVVIGKLMTPEGTKRVFENQAEAYRLMGKLGKYSKCILLLLIQW